MLMVQPVYRVIYMRTHYGIDASSGARIGLESTRIISVNGKSLFYQEGYTKSTTIINGMPVSTIKFTIR